MRHTLVGATAISSVLVVACSKTEALEPEPEPPGSAVVTSDCDALLRELRASIEAAPHACVADTDCVFAGPTLLTNSSKQDEFLAFIGVAKGAEAPVNLAGQRWKDAGCASGRSELNAQGVRCKAGRCGAFYGY